jgi:phospholipid/cholesterol/gamma-HCH transport system substrate-binding protein
LRPSELRWANIRVGLFVALTLFLGFGLLAALGIAGSPLARRAHLHGLFDDVSGLAVGSPVEMGGVMVGEVAEIELPDLETGKVPVRISVDLNALDRTGPSSQAFTGSHALVGQRFVGLTPRRPDEPALKDGDRIRTGVSQTADGMMDEARRTLESVRGLVDELREASGALRRAGRALDAGDGTLGALVHDRELYERLLSTARRTEEFSSAISDPQLTKELRSSLEVVARLGRRIEKGEGLLGRMVTEGKASQHLDRSLANVDLVTGRLAEAKGTLGALISDPSLLSRMNDLLGQVDALIADMRRNPERYIKIQPF